MGSQRLGGSGKLGNYLLLCALRGGVPWLCCGDFNDVLSLYDKRGGAPVELSHLHVIHDALVSCDLSAVQFFGSRFTWCNNRMTHDTIDERLDFSLANSD